MEMNSDLHQYTMLFVLLLVLLLIIINNQSSELCHQCCGNDLMWSFFIMYGKSLETGNCHEATVYCTKQIKLLILS